MTRVLRLALLVTLALTTPAAAQAPLEISFWYGVGGQLQKVIESQAEKFNAAHPGIKVTPFYAGAYGAGGPMQQKLLASMAAGTVPEVVQLEIHATCTFASKGALLPLDDLMAKSDHDRKDDFLPVLTNTGCDGKTYGIPFNRSVPILYWTRDRFTMDPFPDGIDNGARSSHRTWHPRRPDRRFGFVEGGSARGRAHRARRQRPATRGGCRAQTDARPVPARGSGADRHPRL